MLGLQEAVVVGMADGYAQASGQTTVANLHTAPGVGNAMGAIFNAQANHSPLLITAGQQVRAQMTLQANLTNRDAIRMPHPLVKWAYEPARAEDVPLALAHGIHLASLAAARPGLRLDADGRLGRRGRRRRRPRGDRPPRHRPRRRRPRGDRRARRAPRRSLEPGPGRRARHRRQRRLGRRDRPRRAPAAAGLGDARPPAAAGSASRRATPTTAASCRRRSGPSPRPSRATT